MRLNQLSKHFCQSNWGYFQNVHSGAINHFFRCRKTLTSNFIFYVRCHVRTIRRMTTKLIFWVLKNAVVLADVWELALSWWRVIRLRWLILLISWTTTGKLMVVYHSELTVLRCSSGTIGTCPVFPKKQAIICLKVLRARATFVGFGSSWNTVDCCLLSGSYA